LKTDFAKSTQKHQKNYQNELLNACLPQISIAHFTQMRKKSPQICTNKPNSTPKITQKTVELSPLIVYITGSHLSA